MASNSKNEEELLITMEARVVQAIARRAKSDADLFDEDHCEIFQQTYPNGMLKQVDHDVNQSNDYNVDEHEHHHESDNESDNEGVTNSPDVGTHLEMPPGRQQKGYETMNGSTKDDGINKGGRRKGQSYKSWTISETVQLLQRIDEMKGWDDMRGLTIYREIASVGGFPERTEQALYERVKKVLKWQELELKELLGDDLAYKVMETKKKWGNFYL